MNSRFLVAFFYILWIKKITTRKFFGQFLVFDYKWFGMVVNHSAMKKIEKCRLTTLCIKFVKQQNALLMNVMMIAVNYFFLSLLTCSTSFYSNFYSRKNWFNHGFFLDKHYSMGVRGGTNSSGSLGTLRTPPEAKVLSQFNQTGPTVLVMRN